MNSMAFASARAGLGESNLMRVESPPTGWVEVLLPTGPVYFLGSLRVTVSEERFAGELELSLGVSRGNHGPVTKADIDRAVRAFGRGAVEWESAPSKRLPWLHILTTYIAPS